MRASIVFCLLLSGCVFEINPDFDPDSTSATSTGEGTTSSTSTGTSTSTSSPTSGSSDPETSTSSPVTTGGPTSSSTSLDTMTTEEATTAMTTEDVMMPSCGDGVVDKEEECDDGNEANTDACTNACKVAKCGDGFKQVGVDECDDGNNQKGDGCSAWCHLEPTGIGFEGEMWTPYAGGIDLGDPVGSGCGGAVSEGLVGAKDKAVIDYPCKVSNACVDLVIEAGVVKKVNQAIAPKLNACTMEGPGWSQICGQAELAVAIGGNAAAKIESLGVHCSELSLVEDQNTGFSVVLGPLNATQPVGTQLGLPFGPIQCPPGWVIADVAAKVANGNKDIHLAKALCKKPVPTFN